MRHRDPRLVRTLIAAAAVLGTAALVIAVSGGGTMTAGPLVIRAHNPIRPAVMALVLLALTVPAGTTAVGDALTWGWEAVERHAAKAAVGAAMAALATGVLWGTFVAGGSDSYCYLNQAELFARGAVRLFEPLATDPRWPGNAWSFAPAGHVPSADPGYYVPICPAGYPVLLAGARLALGRTAMFWVTPVLGAVLVFLSFVLGRRAAGPAAGVLAAVLTAASPVVLYQIVQPMNDVPAAAFWTLALAAASTPSAGDRRRAVLAGLATAAAVTIRPNLVPLAAIVGLVAASHPGRTLRQRAAAIVTFGAAVLPGVLAVMAVQRAMYGSPLSSGYGDLSALFTTANILPNLQRYPRWLVAVHTPVILAALAAPFVVRPEARSSAAWFLIFAAATFALYLPYVVFDAWWYLRFVLPAIPVLLALAAAVVVQTLRRMPPAARLAAYAIAAVGLAVVMVHAAARRDAFLLMRHEWRFRAAGEYVATLPPNAVMLTGHHTGSVRFYSGRPSVGWGDTPPGRLDDAVAFLREKGLRPYLLFEAWEERDFRQRFTSDRLGGLGWPAAVVIDETVRIYDPDDYERHVQGRDVPTVEIVTIPR